ncbi:MAG TPA: GlsB/YeaQ/YmgE family stress response membrane protein [Micropepsaceae bacterium]|nr:GlsB/YeaQ/YmgE family stress response membrane protein [Micropepsaceae bacterium]
MHILSVYVPQSVIAWIVIGLIAGWLAGTLSRGHGFGCIADIVLGMVGAIIGGWIFTKLGILGGGLLFSIAAATVGAILLVAVARIFSGGGK